MRSPGRTATSVTVPSWGARSTVAATARSASVTPARSTAIAASSRASATGSGTGTRAAASRARWSAASVADAALGAGPGGDVVERGEDVSGVHLGPHGDRDGGDGAVGGEGRASTTSR